MDRTVVIAIILEACAASKSYFVANIIQIAAVGQAVSIRLQSRSVLSSGNNRRITSIISGISKLRTAVTAYIFRSEKADKMFVCAIARPATIMASGVLRAAKYSIGAEIS